MAAMHLGSGVVCCAVVSTIHLKESLSPSQICGFLLMLISVALINIKF
jgi:multidrug transporter EmrE-like cation transporter